MRNIKFEITEADIKEYLTQHSDDREIQNREAMFVKYMREQRIITKESLEILMKKYNQDNMPFSDCGLYSCLSNSLKTLPNFSSYLRVQNLDVSGICHILVPALGYYKDECIYKMASKLYLGVNSFGVKQLAVTLGVPQSDHSKEVLMDALENYQLADKISKKVDSKHGNSNILVDVFMDKEHCERELYEYESIYGLEPVKEIKSQVQKKLRGRV